MYRPLSGRVGLKKACSAQRQDVGPDARRREPASLRAVNRGNSFGGDRAAAHLDFEGPV